MTTLGLKFNDSGLLWTEAGEKIDEEVFSRAAPLFWPWYLFTWEYCALDAAVELAGPEDRTVAELYAEAHGGRLDTLERHLIESINRAPYSFLEVLSVDEGKGMVLKDILKGSRIEVQERSGSQFVQPGDVLFGRAVNVDGVGMLIGLSQTLIPPGRKTNIIDFRKWMRGDQSTLNDDDLYAWETEIRELYFEIDQALHAAPRWHNTDGDPLEFHRLVYDLGHTANCAAGLSPFPPTFLSVWMITEVFHRIGKTRQPIS